MRPSKARQILCDFQHKRFCVQDNAEAQDITIGHDLLEALRLVDAEGASQDEAARCMDVSTPTLCRILGQARQQVALALSGGHNIIIEGGNVKYAHEQGRHGHRHGKCLGENQAQSQCNGQGRGRAMGQCNGQGINGRGKGRDMAAQADSNMETASNTEPLATSTPNMGQNTARGNGMRRGQGGGMGRGQGMGNGRGRQGNG